MNEKAIYERRWWALAVMCLSLLTISLDNTILNVAIPALETHLHASTSQLQWIVDGYTLVFAGLLLTTGSLGDRFGRRGALSVGLAVFGTGSLLSAMSGTANQLIFTRAITGVGAALIMPATLSLLTNIFSDPTERGRAIGTWAAVAGAAGSIGPVLGGFLLGHFWWGSVFLINVPVAIGALVAGRFLLPPSRDPDAPRLDPPGALLSVAGLIAVLWAIIEAPTKGWFNPTVVASFLIGAVTLLGFVMWELHSDHPMLDVRFFRNRRFTAANAGITMVYFAMFGSMFLTTQYLQTVLGYSPLEAGLRMLPTAAVMLVVAPMAPRLVERVGTKLVVGGGLVLATVGLIGMSRVPVSNGYGHLLIAMGFMASGMGLVMAPATESIMGSLPPSKAGVGSAMNDTTRQMGGALGVAVIGSVLATSYRPGVNARLSQLHLPPDAMSAARDSVGGAVALTRTLPASVGHVVEAAAKQEFVDGLRIALFVGAMVVVIAAVIVFAYLPARAVDVAAVVDQPADGVSSWRHGPADGAGAIDEPRLVPNGRDGSVGAGGLGGLGGMGALDTAAEAT
jgi:EmrB/QacA subfamily drug resistance transporter